MTRGFLGLASSLRVPAQGPVMPVWRSLRMLSSVAENEADDQSSQKKLDQLADFLESRPQKASQQSRGHRQKEQRSHAGDSRSTMPSKLFQNGHVRMKR